jgi:DNA (cytosine-5)-methyltransferase 1
MGLGQHTLVTNMHLYTDFDKDVCAWMRELCDSSALPPGKVLQQDINTITKEQVQHYDQVHFFCGIGGWPYALQLAGWTGPVWTASLPCQPFSLAGKQRGTEDERHLWPVFRDLVEQCRPAVCFGEQVASKAGRNWLATVRADLEKLGYAVGAADLCAAGVGAPHIRQRLYWCAVKVAHHGSAGLEKRQEQPAREEQPPVERGGDVGGMVYIPCADGKARPIKPGIEPLVDGLPKSLVRGGDTSMAPDADNSAEARAMRLKGYGNAIVPQVAATFVKSVMDVLGLG